MRVSFLLAFLLPGAAALAAETQQKAEWDVSAPPGEHREIRLDVHSGTWMSLDVSPDGKHIAFDLLGDLYELPIEGGTARALTSGLAWDIQPRYSPDGKQIAFTSDRAGGNNLWIVDAGGGAPRQVTKEPFRLLNSPAWHPEGCYLAGRKHFTTRRSLGTGEIWLYNLDGGEGVQLVKRPSEEYQKELGEPAFSPDGRYLYYTQNATSGERFEYAQDVNKGVFDIRRLELASGEVEVAVSGPGGAVLPTPSPDERWLAFVRRLRTPSALKTALFLKDLRSGAERPLYTELDRDMQETWAIHGVYPTMDWTPDGGSVVFWAGGGIKRVEVASGAVREIAFHVADTRTTVVAQRFAVDVAPEQVRSRMVRFAAVSPDGQRVVFEAFGRLWLQDVNGGQARRLTRDETSAFELFPAWSRDGRRLVFVRWTDAGLGAIHVIDRDGGKSRTVSREPGHYLQPRFSPDGATLVFERASGGTLTSPLWSSAPGIYRLTLGSGAMMRLTDKGRDPHFAASGERVYYTEDAQPAKESEPAHELVSVDINGKDRRVHARSRYASAIEVSPSGAWLGFRENFHCYVTPMPPAGQLELSSTLKTLPLARATEMAGDFCRWSGGDTLTWTVGPGLHLAQMPELFSAAAGASKHGRHVTDLLAVQPADKPAGIVALTGARIVTMNPTDEVIDNGTIVIRDNRITAVGTASAVNIPAGAQRLDIGGRTVLPGLIDVHAHGRQAVNEIIPQQNWSAIAHLALGVTTVHDPAGDVELLAAAEYQRTGAILASRIFSTGDFVYGAHNESLVRIETLEDAREYMGRLKAQGAISVKNYNQPRREQRQMVIAAARAAGLNVVAEGGSLYHQDMNLIVDGIAGMEHNVPPQRFYDDMLQLWPATGVGYTPTMVVNFAGLGSEYWFYQEQDVWRHPILSRFVPPHILQPRSVRRQMAPQSDYQPFLDSAANAKRLMELGVLVNIGAHGEREGLGAHWEIWAFVLGGMSPLQALKTATINPARYMGFARDLGSVEAGKLADLLIVDGDPLTDIRVTDKIAYVVQNGRIYRGGTLEEALTGTRKLAPFYW